MQKKLYIETYGCQMNVADSEVVASILKNSGFTTTENIKDAGLILINTCSIRDNAEQRIWGRLKEMGHLKKKNRDLRIGIIGCMAERLKEKLLETEKLVDIVVGPDAYRELPALVAEAEEGHKAVNVLLSREETYADISPVRMDKNGVSSFVSIMRGCNNMCAYCVVPYVRGAERSRDPESVIREVNDLFGMGYREVTLLGQNVDSYSWKKDGEEMGFPHLLEKVALINPLLRVRFSTSHPKDISDELLYTIARHENICRHIHLPAQSGSSRILKLMNREYTREWYMDRVNAIRRIIPGCAISTDMITGFCTETAVDHKESLSLMEWAGYDFAYMFKYSERPGTKAARKYKDDVPENIKSERLTEMIALQNRLSAKSKKQDLGKIFDVLIEGSSKRSSEQLSGRTSHNKVVVFPASGQKKGEYVKIKIERCTSATLIGEII
ncbi:MAG: tRNA (N6-isopentenyl adenosine(37)-C2)-methylthiotransferase MiaB [Bacteroidetes bacterium GWE2_41_25]|nr:MAG: tRNA (N6-isopentenyl adenosine(37)-C2)-methylthiotransferase MiaB [Bacteroidetes bacterium GWA2_40_15]OFX97397.1 MAG: tRNA (N6-isopentenyl adenosine(37)-C2)-methylthiotransferase MiaB [Bacteroidetes bacterium GWC2_40_22]OFX97831.1 MAG: tRNA (N6-isopentenyl adenosine(37)-C2)-methylthiotransferase MiaB [Bacteroidetes bacterium GWE2_41_25]OFY59472.1 MAG: tRNA (N6-isopentenyl adenosine(37)-C2)-methylthiotransferase MiaB [Bacteroidetes bacterium GWF2_41_9]HAM10852.1 tRNA (N6-isopentenyl aden